MKGRPTFSKFYCCTYILYGWWSSLEDLAFGADGPHSHLPIWHWAPGGGDGCAAGESPVSTLRALRCWVRVGPAGGSEDGLTLPTREAHFLHARPTKQHFIAHWTQKQMNRPTCLPLSQTLKKFLSKKVLPSDSLFVVAVWKIQVISHNIMLYMWTWWFCCYF